MSIKVMQAVWERCPHGGPKLLVMLALAEHADDDGCCWPSVARLARYIRRSERQTQAAMSELIATGLVLVVGNRGGGRAAGSSHGVTRRYRVNVRMLNSSKGAETNTLTGADPDVKGAETDTLSGEKKGAETRTLPDVKGEDFGVKGEEIRAEGVRKSAPEPSLEPSLEPSGLPTAAANESGSEPAPRSDPVREPQPVNSNGSDGFNAISRRLVLPPSAERLERLVAQLESYAAVASGMQVQDIPGPQRAEASSRLRSVISTLNGFRKGQIDDAHCAPPALQLAPALSAVPTAQATIPFDEILAAFHRLCPMLPRQMKWTDKRRAALKARWEEDPERRSVAWWEWLFAEKIARSSFLTGGGRQRFRANLEWIINPNNLVKIIEGRYDDRAPRAVADPIPYDQIQSSYHRNLPQGKPHRVWSPKGKADVARIWNMKPEYQSVQWWERWFAFIVTSDFFAGKSLMSSGKPFEIDLEWILDEQHFSDIGNGRYHRRSA